MLLIFDVEVVIYFLLLDFSVIRMSVFRLEFVLPVIDFVILLTNQFD